MSLRSHQREVLDLARAIRQGANTRAIIAHVTPGGGKSLLPVVLASELLSCGYAERICWIVPRRSLQKQAEEAFSDTAFRTMLSHRHSIRIATNETDPSRGLAGYVTTYAALAVDDNNTNITEFDRRRYILILDEPHHIAVDSAYEKAIAPLVAKARLVLYMSGTLDRDDDLRIAFMPYKTEIQDENCCQVLDLTPTPETAVVTYGRAQALIDRAIIRLKFEHLDSSAKWKEDGFERSMDSFNDGDGSESHKALWTALSTKFAYELLDKTIKSWREMKAVNPRAKLLVVAARQVHAAQYLEYLKAKGIVAGLATMDEGDGALKAIERFKDCRSENRLDALVTVQMAYEGLDCPPITHIACLTNIRSRPWIEQMLARATRNDRAAGSWESQVATVFIPDDPIMRVVIDHITRNDSRAIPPDPVRGSELSGAERVMTVLEPLDSQATEQRQSELISEDEKKALEHAMALAGIDNVTPEQIRKVLALSGYVKHSDVLKQNALTPSQQEDQIRSEIRRWVIAYSQKSKRTPMDLNASIRRHFKKGRAEMTLPELQSAYKWVRAKFPLNSLFSA